MNELILKGNAVAPGVGDWYLGETGYDSQMTNEPEDSNRPNDLYDPLPGDRGAHGRFDRRANACSEQWWLTKNRGWLSLAGVGLAAIAALAITDGRE